MNLPRAKPGELITTELFNALIDAANRARITVGQNSGLTLVEHPDGYTMSATVPLFIWAKITGAISGGTYPWVQLIPTSGGGWTTTSNTGTAYEANGNTSVATNTIVQLYKLATGNWEFRASAC